MNQDQFASFVQAHPDLVILDTTGNKNIRRLAPVTSLKRLEGLILAGPYEDMMAVQGVTSLRFLGILNETWKALSPEDIAMIRKALPDAMVVRVSPMCLGSGWILLLVPALVFVWLLRRRHATDGVVDLNGA